MKKFLLLSILTITIGLTASAQRYAANKDNTGRQVTYAHSSPAYSATVTITPNASRTYVQVGKLTGTLLLVGATTKAVLDDEVVLELQSDTASAGHVVTFGTGFSANTTTITVSASKRVSVGFVFDGTAYIRKQ